MKKTLLTLIAAIMLALGSSHAQSIPKTIQGITLGVTTQEEAINILRSNGLEAWITEDGHVAAKGLVFQEGFGGDSLIVINYRNIATSIIICNNCKKDNCTEDYNIGLSTIRSKYKGLEDFKAGAMAFVKDTNLLSEADVLAWFNSDEGRFIMVSTDHYGSRALVCYMDLFAVAHFAYQQTMDSMDHAPANEVKSVAGCNFGDQRGNVLLKLNSKFGKPVRLSDKDACYSYVQIGGNSFSYANFFFKYNSQKKASEFVSAKFEKHFALSDSVEAGMLYDNIVSQYKRKYSNLRSIDTESGKKISFCGMLRYVEADSQYPIVISLKKSISQGGDMFYYVTVDYFEFNRADLYDDEI